MHRISPSLAMSLIKSWSNSWCTTHRMHEDVCWPCIFGCPDSEDDLHHYLKCTQLWPRLVGFCGLPPSYCHAGAVIKLCLVSPTLRRVKALVLSCRVYHGLKFAHRREIEEAVVSGQFGSVLSLVDRLAQHFARELSLI